MMADSTGPVPDAGNMASLIDAFGMMIGRLPHAALTHSDHVATLFGQVPLAFFNMQFADRPLPGAAVSAQPLPRRGRAPTRCRTRRSSASAPIGRRPMPK